MIIVNHKLEAANSTPEMLLELSKDLLISSSKTLNSGNYENLSFSISLSSSKGRLENSLYTKEEKGSLPKEERDNSNGIEISNQLISLVYDWMLSARDSKKGQDYLAPTLNVEFSRDPTRDSITLVTYLVKENEMTFKEKIGANIFGDGRRINTFTPEGFKEVHKHCLDVKLNKRYLENVVMKLDDFLLKKGYAILTNDVGSPFYASPGEIIRLKKLDGWEK